MAKRYEINETDYLFNYQRFNELFIKEKGKKHSKGRGKNK